MNIWAIAVKRPVQWSWSEMMVVYPRIREWMETVSQFQWTGSLNMSKPPSFLVPLKPLLAMTFREESI